MIYTLTGIETVDICDECFGERVCRHGYNADGIGVHDYKCRTCDYEEVFLVGYACEHCNQEANWIDKEKRR